MTIRALIEAVERGDEVASDAINRDLHRNARDTGDLWLGYDVQKAAFRNDMNAALALHEALLPGWRLHHLGENSATSSGWFCYIFCDYSSGFAKAHDQPSASRAWLLAILRAVEAEGPA